MTPELRWLRSFLAVADEHHFSRAARRLNLAQPALTAHIQQLEEAVGAMLFERSNRMRGLTAAGRVLLPEAQAILERAEGLSRKVKQATHGEAGALRLASGLPAGLLARPVQPAPPKLEIHAVWRGTLPPPPAARWLQMAGNGFA